MPSSTWDLALLDGRTLRRRVRHHLLVREPSGPRVPGTDLFLVCDALFEQRRTPRSSGVGRSQVAISRRIDGVPTLQPFIYRVCRASIGRRHAIGLGRILGRSRTHPAHRLNPFRPCMRLKRASTSPMVCCAHVPCAGAPVREHRQAIIFLAASDSRLRRRGQWPSRAGAPLRRRIVSFCMLASVELSRQYISRVFRAPRIKTAAPRAAHAAPPVCPPRSPCLKFREVRTVVPCHEHRSPASPRSGCGAADPLDRTKRPAGRSGSSAVRRAHADQNGASRTAAAKLQVCSLSRASPRHDLAFALAPYLAASCCPLPPNDGALRIAIVGDRRPR